VHSAEKIRLLGCGVVSRTVLRDASATAGALLICASIVLNIGPFARTASSSVGASRQHASLVTEASNAKRSIARPDAVALQISRLPGKGENLPEPVQISLQPLSVALIEAAPSPAAAMPVQAIQLDRENSEKSAVIGVWAPAAGACSARDFRDGVLPTVITSEGAWAGETFCIFAKRTETENGWRVVAKCSSLRERWTAHVRLRVNDNRLTWTSERGTQSYARCTPDVLMAAR
jgi:hypothetical protein